MDPINIEIDGVRSIHIPDSTRLEMGKPSKLSYYKGVVKAGNQDDQINACDAVILQFQKSTAETKHARLSTSNHRCVLETIGNGVGVGKYENFSFLALRPFNITFEAYIVKHGPGVDKNGRFTEDFIKLISDIIDGIEELHGLGYYCPFLKGDHIAVIEQCNSITAKLWDFRSCSSGGKDQEENADWHRLEYLILRAAGHSDEANDLFERIKCGQLKGKSILKHTVLQTVRKKFDNVLALQFHISVNHPPDESKSKQKKDLEIEDICAANLNDDLDRRVHWTMPACVSSRSSTSPPKTLRGFISQLRIVANHESLFIPEEMTRELTFKEITDGKKKKDLEQCLQSSCSELFRAVQMLAVELKLQY